MVLQFPKINNRVLAEYTSLMRYTSAWRSLDVGLLKKILDAKVEFDAPGIPYDVVGIEKVIEVHKVFFDNLRDNDNHLREINPTGSVLSGYNVITQIYPYEYNGVYPFMQLSYFTEYQFLKLYYFFVEVTGNLKKIKRIKTHHTKFLVSTNKFNQVMEQINSLNGVINSK